MNKSELVASIAEKSGLTKKDAEQALNGFISSFLSIKSLTVFSATSGVPGTK